MIELLVSGSGVVPSGSIPSRLKPKTQKWLVTALLRRSIETKLVKTPSFSEHYGLTRIL